MKRIIAMLLSICMIVSMVPAGAFAAELETEPVSESQAVTEAPAESETEALQTEAEETTPTETAEAAAVETQAPAAETVAETIEETEPAAAETTEAVAQETAEEGTMSQEEFAAALEEANGSNSGYSLTSVVYITSDLAASIPYDKFLTIENGGKLIITNGAAMKVNQSEGGLKIMDGGTLDVTDGRFEMYRGVLQVETGGTVLGSNLFVGPYVDIEGIELSRLSVDVLIGDSYALQEILHDAEKYASVHIRVGWDMDYDYSDTTIPSNTHIEINSNVKYIGRLEVNGGTLDVNGTLSASAGSDVYRDHIYLNGGCININGSLESNNDVYVTGGSMTIAADAALTANKNMNVSEDATVTNNGNITIAGDLIMDGTWNGNEPVIVKTAEDDFRAAVAAAEDSGENLTIWDEITLTEDLTINMTGELSFADFSKLVVPSGVTMTLNCPTIINGATLVVEAGGKLISNVNLSIVAPLNPATFDMNGAFENNGQVWVNEGGTVNINGTAISYYREIHVGFGGNGASSTLNVNGTLTTYGYLNIVDGGAPGVLNVYQGATLNILNNENGCGYLDNTSRVQIDGTLNLDGRFTTGALLEDGTVVGRDASADIRGTVIGSESSSIGVLPQGSVNFFGALTTAGEVVVEPQSALWIDNTATLNGPVSVAGYLHVDYIDDVDGVGVLNLNGTTDVTGYLAVHDGGTLNAGASSVLNIQNIEDVGCGYLDNQGTVTLDGEMNLDGLFTTGAAQDDDDNVVGPAAFAENNGAINASATSTLGVGIDGTLTNNGTITTSGELNIEGTWLGNDAVVKENVLPFEDFKAAMATGRCELTAKVTVEENLTVDSWLYIYGGGELIVPAGVTLTVNSAVTVMGGKLAVEEGGSLVNNSHLYVEGNGILEVAGTYTAERYNYLFAQYGASTVTGVDKDMITIRCLATGEENLRAAAAMTGYREVQIDMNESVRLSTDLVIEQGVELRIYNSVVLTVPSGVTLSVNGSLSVFDAGVVVEPGGKLLVSQQGYMQLTGAYLHAEGATLDIVPQRLHVNLGGVELIGVDLSVVGVTASVGSYAELCAALDACGQYGFVEIEPYTTITLEENLTIPGNSMFAMYDQGELMQLIIPDGVTVFNCTTIVVNNNCQIWIQTGGTLDNSQGGSVNDYTGTGLIVDGTLIADTTGGGGGGGGYSGVTTFEELKAAVEAGQGWIEIYGSVYITEDLVLPSNGVIQVYADGEFIVASGVSVTGESSLEINGGMAKLEAGGSLSARQIFVDGTFIVEDGAAYSLPDNNTVTVTSTSTVVGVPKDRCSLAVYVYSEEDIRAGFKHTGYNWISAYLYEDVTLSADLTVPENASLFAFVHWYYGETHACTLTVPEGKTITNNGFLITTEPDGRLVIEQGGKVINNNTINNRGILLNDGQIVNNGTVYLYGEVSGDGTITGDGHVDFARPVYSYADLVNWLSADLVPTYLYVWGEVTLEDDVTIPVGTQLIMEGSTLIVPSGVTVTMDGELYAQYGGVAAFQAGSKLVNNNYVEAYRGGTITFEQGSKVINCYEIVAFAQGTINLYGEYVRENEDANLTLYPEGTINGVASSYIHYAADFTDDASLAAILSAVETQGYGQFTARVKFGCGVVELYNDVTIPENGYLFLGKYYEDTLVLKSGAVLTNYGEVVVAAPGTLVVESGAELINHGKIDADEGTLIYQGGGISIGAEATAVYGKGKLNLTAAITPESMSGARITWTLAEGHELYASVKGSGSKAVLTAADVTGRQTVKVTASATLDNGAEVSDTIEITIVPLVKQIALVSDGQDVTGKTVSFDLNYIPEGKTEAQRSLDLTALVAPGDADTDIAWTSSSNVIAAVDGGKVTFTGKTGKVTITASANDGSRVSAKVTIEAVKLVQSITLLSGDAELVGGKGTTLKVQDASNPGKALAASAVTWTLADEKDTGYVTVTATGKVTTKAVPQRISVTLLGTIVGNPDAQPIEHILTVYPAVTLVDILCGGASVSGQTLKADSGTQLILSARQYPADAMGEISWDVKDSKVAAFEIDDNNNLIVKPTGIKGSVSVKAVASDGSKKSATVKLQLDKYVSQIQISAESGVLLSGQSMQLTANVQPADASNKAVVWSLADADDKQYVSVSSSGKVTAKKGLSMSKDITILAAAKDGSGAVGGITFRLQPADAGALVILGEEGNVTGTTLNVDLLTGGNVKLKAKYFNTDSAKVTWSGKNVNFGPMDEDGFITANVSSKGTFTVTADDGNGKKASVKLKAANLSEGLAITGDTSVASGKNLQLTATVLPEGKVADKKVTWWIDEAHTAYAKISSSGKVTAAKNLTDARSITVWAQAKDGNSEAVSVNIDILPLAQSVQVLEGGTDVTNGTIVWDLTADTGKLDLSAEVFPAGAGQGADWKISGKVVERAADGTWRFTGKTGTATITATASDGSGKKASFKLNVLKSMEFIEQSKTETVIAGGKSLKLASFLTVDSGATNKKLTWSMTGDTEVATLSATGVLKTQKVTDMKTIVVTAEAQDGSGCKAEFTVLVYPATTSVKLLCDGEAAPKQVKLGIGETLTLEGISLPTAAAQGCEAYDWKASSEKTVSLTEKPDGTVTVTGLASGTVTVTCTAADGTGKKAAIKIVVG